VVFLCACLSMQGLCSDVGFLVGFFGGFLMVRFSIHGEAGPKSRLPKVWFFVGMFLFSLPGSMGVHLASRLD
jgi:hypothetical protein